MTEPRDCDAVVVGTGPAGATAADVLTGAGWSVIMLEKGRNHLLALDAPFGPLGHVSNDEIKSLRRHFLGPDPFLEPRTYRRDDADGDRLFAGEVNNLPSTVGGGGFHADGKLPRFRAVDFKPLSELGPIEGADIVDWPVDYDEMEPYYAEAETPHRRGGRRGRQPVRGVAQRPVPDAARRRHVRRGPHRRGRDPPRLPPLSRADGRELGPLRRPARVQQLRVLRALRLPDRSQGRSRRAAAQRAAHRPLRDPPGLATSSACCSTRRASRRAACATSTSTATRTR